MPSPTKCLYFSNSWTGNAEMAEGGVHGIRQVLEGIQERSVKIEDYGLKIFRAGHLLSPTLRSGCRGRSNVPQNLLDGRLDLRGCLKKEHSQIESMSFLGGTVPNYSDRYRQGVLGQTDFQSEPAGIASDHEVILPDLQSFQFQPRTAGGNFHHSDIDIFLRSGKITGQFAGPRNPEAFRASSFDFPTGHFQISCQGAGLKPAAREDEGLLAIAASRNL